MFGLVLYITTTHLSTPTFWARPTCSFVAAKTQFSTVVISCSRYRGIQMMDSLEYFQPDMFTHVSWRRRCWGARHLVSNGGVLLSTQFGVLLWKTTPILHMMAMCIFIQDTVVAAEPELDQHPSPLLQYRSLLTTLLLAISYITGQGSPSSPKLHSKPSKQDIFDYHFKRHIH